MRVSSLSNYELIRRFEYNESEIVRVLCNRLYDACLDAEDAQQELEDCIACFEEDIAEFQDRLQEADDKARKNEEYKVMYEGVSK